MKEKKIFMLIAATLMFAALGCSPSGYGTPFREKIVKWEPDALRRNFPGSGSLKGEAFGDGNDPVRIEPAVGDISYTPREESISLGENPALSDYLRYAALNNAGLKAAFEQWRISLEQIPQVQSLPDPKFTYGYFIEDVETRVGPQQNRLEIMQMFPWFGKIEARTDVAASNAKAARQRYEAAKLKLFFEVKDAYYEYIYLARAIKIAKENLELIKHFEQVAQTKYVTAAISHPDVIRAQVELAKLEDNLKTLEQLRIPIVARLNASLNRQSLEMLPWPQEQREFKAEQVSREKVISLLREQNPELKALDFEREAAQYRVELVKKKFWPDVGVGVGWIDTGSALNPGMSDSGKDPIILMLTMNVPIWRESYKAAELQAKADVRRTSQQKTEMENTIVDLLDAPSDSPAQAW